MAITHTGRADATSFFGLSTDTKPASALIGSTFTETDTQKAFVYDGAEWVRSQTTVVEQLPSVITTGLVQTAATDDLLGEILVQMKLQNAHLALVTGEQLSETDIEEA